MKFETKRLIIRYPSQKDAKYIAQGLSPLEVRRYMAAIPNPYTIQQAREFIKDSKGKQNFLIELKECKKVIGGIGLANFNDLAKEASIGYWLNQNYWKQGIISEAITEILKFAFENLGLKRITLTCSEKNEGSKAIAKKFGFKLQNTVKKGHNAKATGENSDKLVYILLKEDWNKK